MAQLNPWSQTSSALPTQEELLQQMLDAGAVPGQTAPPGVTPTKPKAVLKAAKKAAPSPLAMGAALPAQQPQPGAPFASPGTSTLPYQGTEDGDQDKTVHTQQRAYLLDPSEIAESLKKFGQISDVQSLKKGNQDYRDMIAMEAAQPESPNLSGAMALGDVLTNNKYDLRAGYKAPGDKAKELLANMDKAQDNQRDLTKELIALSNARKAGMDTSILQTLLTSKLTDGFKTAPPPRPSGIGVNNSDKWNKNTRQDLAGDDKFATDLGGIIKDVELGNPINDARVSTLMASKDAGGRPNMAEVNNEAANREIVARAQNAWSIFSTGKMSERNRTDVLNALYDFANYRQKVREHRLDRAKNQGKTQYNQSDAQINSSLTPDYVNAYPTRAAGTAVAPPTSAREAEMQSIQDSNKALLQHLDDLKKSRGGK